MTTSKKMYTGIIFLLFFLIARGQINQKKALIHYMGWFGEGQTGRHWSCGQTNTPLIGYYNSLSWATQVYHILLSWSCGIDGLVINVKDAYDDDCMNTLVQTLQRLKHIDSDHFMYDFTISYDDQGLADVYAAKTKFIHLRDYILTEPIDFLRYNNIPVIFTFNYPDEYLTAQDYNTALEDVFPANKPQLVWNQVETDALGYVSSFFPWVQPGGTWNGVNWGQEYLDWFYPEVNNYTSQLEFATGGVWAGFDDRDNHCWGGTRWIDRQNGTVYNNTWKYINNYTGVLPVFCAVIETWNDWNEGTQIEPSEENGYQYLKLTINNINAFKGTSVSTDTGKFEDARKIYFLADSIEKGLVDSVSRYPVLEDAIYSFLHHNAVTDIANNLSSDISASLGINSNPVISALQFEIFLSEASEVILYIIDLNGCVTDTVYSGFLNKGQRTIEWNASELKTGIYICFLQADNKQLIKKIVII